MKRRILFILVFVCISSIGNTRETKDENYHIAPIVEICVKMPEITPLQAIDAGYGGAVDKRLLRAICQRETGCLHAVDGRIITSRGGQVGAMQIDPVNFGRCDGLERVETTYGNIQCAGALLNDLLSKYGLFEAVMAYNGGEQSLKKGHKNHERAYNYAKGVLKIMRKENK